MDVGVCIYIFIIIIILNFNGIFTNVIFLKGQQCSHCGL